MEYAVSLERAIVTFNTPDFEVIHREWLVDGRDHFGILLRKTCGVAEFVAACRYTLQQDFPDASWCYNNILWLRKPR